MRKSLGYLLEIDGKKYNKPSLQTLIDTLDLNIQDQEICLKDMKATKEYLEELKKIKFGE